MAIRLGLPFGSSVSRFGILALLVVLLTASGVLKPAMAPGVPFNVYGYVKDDSGSPVTGAAVTVRSPIDQGSTTTDSEGRYAVTLSVNGPGDSISVSATHGSLSGSASGTVPSGTSSMQIDVTLRQPGPPPPPPPPPTPTSAVTISLTKAVVAPGESVTITGTVSPSRAITVAIEVSTDQASWTNLAQVTSTAAGVYSRVWVPPGAEITYYLRSSIPASGDLPSATSGVVSLQVTMMPDANQRLTNSTTLPTGEPCRVQACSSSSSLTMSIDVVEKKISITVSGPSGTTGTTMIFLPDELLNAYGMTAEDLLFTVDGVEVTPTMARVPGGYVVTLTYTHSQHTVAIYYVTYRLEVSVLDDAGNPVVAGTTVNMSGPVTRIASTNSSGIVVFTKLVAGDYTISASEPAGNATLTVSKSGHLVLRTTIGSLQAQYQELHAQYQQLQDTYQQLQTAYEGLQAEHQSLEATYQQLQREYQEVQEEYEKMRTLALAYGAGSVVIVIVFAVLLHRARKG